MSAHRAVATRELQEERGNASITMGSLLPPLSSVADAKRTISLARTVPLNMRGATRLPAQVAQACKNLFLTIFLCLLLSILLEVFSVNQSVSLFGRVLRSDCPMEHHERNSTAKDELGER